MSESYELTNITLARLGVDEYQRGLVKNRADRIAGRFDVAKAGVVIISKRPREGWFIIDGQHRVDAAITAGVSELPAILWDGLTMEREAELFYSFNNDRYAVNPVDLFRTRVIAADPVAAKIVATLHKVGVKVGHGNRAASATAAIEAVHKWGYLEETTRTLTTAYPENRRAINGNPLLAVGSLFKNFGGNLDEERLVAVLKERPLTTLLQAAEGMRAGLGGALWPHLAVLILNEYNTGRRDKLAPYHKPTRPQGGKFNLTNPSAG